MAPIQACLASKLSGQQRAYVLGSVLLLLAGLAASALTLAAYDYPLRFYVDSPTTRLAISLALLVLTVLVFRPREPAEETIPSPSGRRIPVPRTRGGAYSSPYTPGPFAVLVRVIASVLLFGPRLLGESWTCLRKAHRLGKFDLGACAAAVTALYRSEERVPLKEVYLAVPEQADPAVIVSQLLLTRGVMLLHEPTSLILTSEFRGELRDWVALAKERKRRSAVATE